LKDLWITVYQEQVMLLSQKIADFSRVMPMFYVKRWERKDVLDKMKPKFISQAAAKGHPKTS
jgi:DNA polymerase-3 subunit alpha